MADNARDPAMLSVPSTGRPADGTGEGRANSEPRRTDPKTVWIGMLASVPQSIVPAIAITFGTGGAAILALPVVLAIVALGTFASYLNWRRLTYTIGAQDIRVESGILSRAARSVPYERIQDVSLEQKLLARLFGLVAVKFETGAGGGEDLSLSFLTEEQGEQLRNLVRERRDEQETASSMADVPDAAPDRDEHGETLFAMDPSRLFTFGLFEFSLAVFAVLAGLLQYADSLLDFEVWDPDLWQAWINDLGIEWDRFGAKMQVLGALVAVLGLLVVGSLTGMVRVFTRDWGFLLERTARGFRRRRGLFTRTDVVMPIHRVQGVKIRTGFLRYRFGWHSLSFVSLAQDAGASSHVVAPFAKLEEIAPIAEAAGFRLPGPEADWCRAATRYKFDSAFFDALWFVFAAIIAGVATTIFIPQLTLAVVGILLVLAGLSAIANVLAWQFHRHALDDAQIMASRGVLSPRSQIANRQKLHSVEIVQGPVARIRGYATLHLGQAGGEYAIPGIPIVRALEVRRKIMQTIAETDFSQLDSQRD